jgi:hypothetical protein
MTLNTFHHLLVTHHLLFLHLLLSLHHYHFRSLQLQLPHHLQLLNMLQWKLILFVVVHCQQMNEGIAELIISACIVEDLAILQLSVQELFQDVKRH